MWKLWLLKPAEYKPDFLFKRFRLNKWLHIEGVGLAFIGMYEMMQMEVLNADSVITDISVEIPKLCDSGPALMNWLHENATE